MSSNCNISIPTVEPTSSRGNPSPPAQPSANDASLNKVDNNNNDARIESTDASLREETTNFELDQLPSPIEAESSSPREENLDDEIESVVTAALGTAEDDDERYSPEEIEAAVYAAFGLTPPRHRHPASSTCGQLRERTQNSEFERPPRQPFFVELPSVGQQSQARTYIPNWNSTEESEVESDNNSNARHFPGLSSNNQRRSAAVQNTEGQIPLVPISPPLNILEEMGITADQAVLLARMGQRGPPGGYISPRGYSFPAQPARRAPLPFFPHVGEPPHELFADTDEESEEEQADDVVAPEFPNIRGIRGFLADWFWRFIIFMLRCIFPQGTAEIIADMLQFELPSIRECFFMLISEIWNLLVWIFRSDPARPMTASELNLIEPHAVSSEDILSEETCAICFEEFEAGEDCVELPCGHIFHRACLNSWLILRGDCPMCRRSARNMAHRFHFILQYLDYPPTFLEMWDLTQEIDNEPHPEEIIPWFETFGWGFFNFGFFRQEVVEDPPFIVNFQIPLAQLEAAAVESVQEI